MTMVVGADGVTELDDGFGEPGFNVGGVPFERWMNGNHLDDAGTVMCCG